MSTARTRALLGAALLFTTVAAGAQEPAWTAEARKVAGSVPPKLLAVLNEEIAASGPEGAILVCRDKAPQLAKAASEETGWAIRRVSLKNRNPRAVPDAWERAALEDFDRRAAAGENPATLEKAEVVTVDGKATYRYMKALPTQPLCVACHGPADQLSPAVRDKLKALYPDDKAVGYRPGEIRGAITIHKPA
jgi:mono/diheme cytochrome c family protein